MVHWFSPKNVWLAIKRAWWRRRAVVSSTKLRHNWGEKLFSVKRQEKLPNHFMTSFQNTLVFGHSQKRCQRDSDVFSQKEHCSLDESPTLKRYLFVEIRRWINLNRKTLNLDSRVQRNGKVYALLQSISSTTYAWKSEIHLSWFLCGRDACRVISICCRLIYKSSLTPQVVQCLTFG